MKHKNMDHRDMEHKKMKDMDDWYKIKTNEIHEFGGGGLLSDYYGGSLVKALSTIYKEHNWQNWR